MHTHFYGNQGTKFRKMLIEKGKRSVFTRLFQLRLSGLANCVPKKGSDVLRPMSESTVILTNAVAAAKETLQSLLDLESHAAKAADLIEQCLRAGNKLARLREWRQRCRCIAFCNRVCSAFYERSPCVSPICLACDGGLLTAAGNDYGFDEIFARQVAAFGLRGDVLICLTTSGKSKNIERALQEQRRVSLKNYCFPGS